MKLIELDKGEIFSPDILIPTFLVEGGAIIKLEGESGIGKSSFLQSLVMLKKMQYQDWKLINQPVSDIQIREKVLYLPQISGSEQEITDKFVTKILSNNEIFDIESTHNLLKEFDLGHIWNRPLNKLSGGERQLLNLSIGMHLKRSVLLCDESFSAIDTGRIPLVMQNLDSWMSKEKAIIYVSHQALPLDQNRTQSYIIQRDSSGQLSLRKI